MAQAEGIRIFDPHRFVRAGQAVTLESAYSTADRLREPCVMRLGGWGIDGIDPRVWIHDRTDLRRLGPDIAGERPMMREWIRTLKLLSPDACIVDIGAGAGAYSLAAATVLSGGRVVAMEPDPESFERLCKNTKLNYLDRSVMAMPIAIGGREHTVRLHTDGANGSAPSLRDGRFGRFVRVPMYSLDYLVEHGIIPLIDAMKIDVEGAEVDPLDGVFTGMRFLLDQGYPRHIFLETHSAAMVGEFGGTTEEVLTMLLDRGYREAFRLDDPRKGPPLYHFVCEAHK